MCVFLQSLELEEGEEGEGEVSRPNLSLPSLSLLQRWYLDTHQVNLTNTPITNLTIHHLTISLLTPISLPLQTSGPPLVVIVEDYEGFPPLILHDIIMSIRFAITNHYTTRVLKSMQLEFV